MAIAIVQGTRPEIIKNYAIVKALTESHTPYFIFHTNQHRDQVMRDSIYLDMGYEPTHIQPQAYNLGDTIRWLQEAFQKNGIHHVIVNGDTAASLAGALAAMYLDIPVSHIEAGLRARDPYMLEERNRIMVDAVSHLLFAYTSYEKELLLDSPDIRGEVFVEGNTTVDVINDFACQLQQSPCPRQYVFVTLHRRELTESYQRLKLAIDVLNTLANEHCPVVFPIHPRTQDALARHHLTQKLSRAIDCIDPVTALQALNYQKHARVVLTDSGCIQEEAYMLGTPCVTFRENTERHLTVSHGANTVTGFHHDKAVNACVAASKEMADMWPAIYGAEGVGARIIERINAFEGQTFEQVSGQP
jgi:UDP-N-acetylglucosamine 2-epimerase (non-hydrolysing)